MTDTANNLIAQAREHVVICTDWTACSAIAQLATALEAALSERDEAKAARDVHEDAAIEFCAAADKAEAENRRLREALTLIAAGEAAYVAAPWTPAQIARAALAGSGDE